MSNILKRLKLEEKARKAGLVKHSKVSAQLLNPAGKTTDYKDLYNASDVLYPAAMLILCFCARVKDLLIFTE